MPLPPPDGPPTTPTVEDPKRRLLSIFSGVVEVQRPDFDQILAIPEDKLARGQDEVGTLVEGLVRPNADELDPRAAGRQRFPALQGTAALFAEGLEKHPDLAAEILADGATFRGAVALDQSLGRLVFCGELLHLGADTGELLAATAAQRLCLEAAAEARRRIADPSTSAPARSDLSVAFAETFRLQQDAEAQRERAAALSAAVAQPYLGALDEAKRSADLAAAVDAYLSSLKEQP